MSRFIEIAENPVPANATVGEFKSFDGATLRYAFFAKESARGTIILEPGWSEFIEKYFETIDDLRARGWAVAMMDWRGQGLSDRDRDTSRDWNGYFGRLREDLRLFTDTIVATHLPAPFHLMTHSMGGLPGLMLLADGSEQFASAVLCAPMTRVFKPVPSLAYRAGVSLACLAGMANTTVGSGSEDARQFEGNMFTTDPRRHERFRLLQLAEPRACVASPTYGWVRESFRDSDRLHKMNALANIKAPTMIVSAGAERRIDGTDHPLIAERSSFISNKVIDGALHEIMMERDALRDQFLNAVETFFLENQ